MVSSATYQSFDPINAQGQIKYHGSDLCLDAGSNPSNGVGLKLWTCGDYPQQKFNKVGSMLQTANSKFVFSTVQLYTPPRLPI